MYPGCVRLRALQRLLRRRGLEGRGRKVRSSLRSNLERFQIWRIFHAAVHSRAPRTDIECSPATWQIAPSTPLGIVASRRNHSLTTIICRYLLLPLHSSNHLSLKLVFIVHVGGFNSLLFLSAVIMSASSPDNKTFQFKLVLLGDSAVGKSSLVLRFVKGHFHEYQESTIGGIYSNILCVPVAHPNVGFQPLS